MHFNVLDKTAVTVHTSDLFYPELCSAYKIAIQLLAGDGSDDEVMWSQLMKNGRRYNFDLPVKVRILYVHDCGLA
jgi:hypothetical protein